MISNKSVFTVCIQEDELLSLYKAIYDIVLTGDSDMTVINSVVRAVLHHRSEALT